MRYKLLISVCALAGAALAAGGCEQRNDAEDMAKVRRDTADEVAKIRREADEKIAAAQKEADKKIADAQREATKDIADKRKDEAQEIAKEQRELEQALQSAKKDTLDEYKDYVKKRVRLLELRQQALQANIGTMAQADHDKLMTDLDTRRNAVRATIADLDKATADSWQATKARVDAAVQDLERTIERAERGPTTRAQR